MPRSGLGRTGYGGGGRESFNEAGAIMPRSGIDGDGRPIRLPVASMRPGQSCPGVGIERCGGDDLTVMLQ